ncbi:MAG: hypothetical protein AAFX78_04855 [Cyanobacteria bacterium J06638_20]
MRFDRVLVDILEFIRRWLYWQDAKVTAKPFESIRDFPISHRGVLQHIKGRDTERSIDTWRWCPKTNTSEYIPLAQRDQDIHIYLDYHPMLPEFRKPSGNITAVRYQRDRPTHQILMLKAGHHLNPKTGEYDVEYLSDCSFDFSKGVERSYEAINRKALRATSMLAKIVALHSAAIGGDRWRWKQEMRQIFHRVTRADEPFVNTFAYREFKA